MKQKGILILALALGVIAVILVQVYIRDIEKKHEVEDTVSVLVAAKNIPAGTAVTGTQITTEKVPRQFLNPNAVLPKELELILNQTTSIDLQKGQQILWTDFVSEKETGLATVIKEGERALTLDVNDRTGVSGLLKPNDHVDIIGTFQVPKEVKIDAGDLRKFQGDFSYQFEQVTVTLLQNVTVLAVGKYIGTEDFGPGAMFPAASGMRGSLGMDAAAQTAAKRLQDKMSYRTVTVLVTPLEAELLVHAMLTGEITLALRNPEDLMTELKLPNIKFTDVVKSEFVEEIQQKRTERTIEIYKGPGQKKRRR